jgi:uncharacterized membrane protein YeaQ/YmgE (transglycosylase-associated protein family)
MGNFIWTIVIGFAAGVIAKLITPGKNEPSGFILTTILGIVGAYAGFFGAIVGAIILLFIWGKFFNKNAA